LNRQVGQARKKRQDTILDPFAKQRRILFSVALEIPFNPCMVSCMAVKTISLELDAYERLKRAKRGKESFSAVVRRARFDLPQSTGAAILAATRALYDSREGVPKRTFDYWAQVEAEEAASPRISDSEWGGRG